MKLRLAFILSMLTGFIFLSFEILWIRFFSFATKGSPVTFGLVLGFYLLGLGLGAGLIRFLLSRDFKINILILQRMLIASAFFCYLVMPATVLMSTYWFYAYKYGFGLVFVACLSFGGIFPLVVQCVKLSIAEKMRNTGQRVSYIYTANIIGSVLGTLFTGFLLLDIMSSASISTLLSVILILIAVTLSFFTSKQRNTTIVFSIFLAVTMFSFRNHVHENMYEKLMYMPRSKALPPFVRIVENRSGVITVTQNKTVYGNGAYDGFFDTSLSHKINPEIENPYLLFLFHQNPADILEIGLASGSWAQIMVNGPNVKSLTSVEINPGYLELIAEHDEVKSLLRNPKFNLVIDDGRRWLSANEDKKFDLIVLNVTFHWRAHSTDLLSFEFMQILKRHLNPAGMIYLNTTLSWSSMRTVASSFAYTARRGIYVIASDSPIMLDRIKFGKILSDFQIDGRPVLDLSKNGDLDIYNNLVNTRITGEREQLLLRTEGYPVIYDDNMVTEFSFLNSFTQNRD